MDQSDNKDTKKQTQHENPAEITKTTRDQQYYEKQNKM